MVLSKGQLSACFKAPQMTLNASPTLQGQNNGGKQNPQKYWTEHFWIETAAQFHLTNLDKRMSTNAQVNASP